MEKEKNMVAKCDACILTKVDFLNNTQQVWRDWETCPNMPFRWLTTEKSISVQNPTQLCEDYDKP